MKRFHIAISTNDIEATIQDYSDRLQTQPCLVMPGEYALWRTDTLNLSVRKDSFGSAGEVRHLGWEDSESTDLSAETDVNGIVWERFSASTQADEINEIWSDVNYQPES